MISKGGMKRPRFCLKCGELFLAITKHSKICLTCYGQRYDSMRLEKKLKDIARFKDGRRKNDFN